MRKSCVFATPPRRHDFEYEQIPALLIRGQIESVYSRTEAADTFSLAKQYDSKGLINRFSWDSGVLSYFSSKEVSQTALNSDITRLNYSWTAKAKSSSDKAIIVSVDPIFFRIYGPMMLFNAQQVPEINFVFLICATEGEVRDLTLASRRYLATLSNLNHQSVNQNISFYAVDIPDWVQDRKTFYACARFLALPDMLQRYKNVYCMDADLLMKDDPVPFFARTSRLKFSVPKNSSLIGIIPWRRHMAGSLVANRAFLESPALCDLNRYISSGLQQAFSWTLDQNALSFAAERAPASDFEPLDKYARPAMVSKFMVRWERNYPTV